MTTAIETTALADGLRGLAAMVDADPAIAEGRDLTYALGHILAPVDDREAVVAIVRAAMRAGGAVKKYQQGDYAGAVISFGPIHLQVYTAREQICERVVVATREVTEEVPDPDAVAALPKVTITKTVEDVEWKCMPLLADREDEAGA